MGELKGKLLGQFEQDIETLANWYIAGKEKVRIGWHTYSLYEICEMWADDYEVDVEELEAAVASKIQGRLKGAQDKLKSLESKAEREIRFPDSRRKIHDTLPPYKYLWVEDAIAEQEKRIERIVNFTELP